VSLIDVFPALREILQNEADLPLQDSLFLPLLVTKGPAGKKHSEHLPFLIYTLIVGDKKLVLHGLPSGDMNSYETVEIYDLPSGEKRNLADTDRDLHEMFEQLIQRALEIHALGNAVQHGDPPVDR
jgi:hypothetical protein